MTKNNDKSPLEQPVELPKNAIAKRLRAWLSEEFFPEFDFKAALAEERNQIEGDK